MRTGSAVVLACAVAMTACASKPLETDLPVSTITPAEALEARTGAGADEQRAGPATEDVIWGGTILSVANLAAGTQIEVLAYPLNRVQRPTTGARSQGRFLLSSDEFLEPVDFAPGRAVTVLGRIGEIREGALGDARYRLPTVEAREVHLWMPGSDNQSPRFTFGLGVNLSN